MRKQNACLAIGIGDAPPLDYLRGAVNGAIAMARWARPNYTTRLLTDRRRPVTFAMLKNALEKLLEPGPDRLIIYFAGHGLWRSPAEDLWLLSRWQRMREAVSVSALRARLFEYGIGQLVIVSDACRTRLGEDTQNIDGRAVIEPGKYYATPPKVDSWFATGEGRVAWMIQGHSPSETRCIFSGVLEEALAGCHSNAFDGNKITNHSLADFMEKEVPTVAARYMVELQPWINTAIRPTDNVYVETKPPRKPKTKLWPKPDGGSPTVMVGRVTGGIRPDPGESWSSRKEAGDTTYSSAAEIAGFKILLDKLTELGVSSHGGAGGMRPPEERIALTMHQLSQLDAVKIAEAKRRTEATVRRNIKAFQHEQRPKQFELGAVVVVNGGEVSKVRMGGGVEVTRMRGAGVWGVAHEVDRSRRDEGRKSSIVRAPDRPQPLLVQMDDGEWLGAAAIPGFVLSFTLGEGNSWTAIYRRRVNPLAQKTEEIMARVCAGDLGREHGPEILEALHENGHADPMLGVLAAYLYDAMGDTDNVRRIARYFANKKQPIPFDIALLARIDAVYTREPGTIAVSIPGEEAGDGKRHGEDYRYEATEAVTGVVAGAFPFLRQGWDLLDPNGRGVLYPEGLATIGEQLREQTFTTLNAIGGEGLAYLLFERNKKALLRWD